MIAAMNSALRGDHVADQVDTVGQVIPRGTTGAMFAGGLVGDEVGGAVGGAGRTLAGRSRSKQPQHLVFKLPRAGLAASVRGRVNVRILTLQAPDGTPVELEGNRLSATHGKDVIDALRAS
jgi:hypothetical protein